MKKILSLVLTLVLVCGLAVSVMAANVDISADNDFIAVGETVTVTITLDETIPAEADTTAVQMILSYDWDVLEYVADSGVAGEGYDWLAITASSRNPQIKLNSGTDFTVKTLPAGTVAVLKFTAKQDTTYAGLVLSISLKTSNSAGAGLEDTSDSLVLTVCSNHSYVVTEQTAGTCYEPGSITYHCESCTHTYTEPVAAACQNIVHVAGVEPGCHYTGNIEHWYCLDCGTVWQDEARTQITNHMNVVLPALGGEVVHVEAVAATCYAEGNIEYWYCEECEQVWQDEALTQLTNRMNVILPTTEHSVVHMDAVEPACHYSGNIEHWYCTICDTVWQDEALTQITNHMNVILPALGGEVVHVEAVAPTCYTEGNIEHWYCEECGQVWQNEALTQLTNRMNVILPAACQNIVHVEAVEPACHYTGNIEHWYCLDCGTVWQDEAHMQVTNHMNVILPALGGEVVHVPAGDATCTENGHIEHWYCEECEQVWQDEALTQLTNRMNVITEVAHGHQYDDDEDMICNVCEFDRTNSHTGDVAIVVAAAAAVISMTGVVALPIAKKKFF